MPDQLDHDDASSPLGSLLFRQPAPSDLLPTPSPSPEATATPADPAAGSPSDSDALSDALLDPEPDSDPTSSPASSADRSAAAPSPLGKAATRDAARQAVLIGSAMAHRALARTEAQQAVGLYLADTDDASAIADPVAKIIGRRAGAAGAAANPDVADAISMMLGLAGFASKQVVLAQQARQLDLQTGGGHTAAQQTVDL
jgi:hypothetical protein